LNRAPAILLSDLLRGAGVTPVSSPVPDPMVGHITLDSREAKPGSLFCAVRGLRTDGERFIGQAIERGTVAVLAGSPRPDRIADSVAWVQAIDPRMQVGPIARELYGRPDEGMTLAGFTGTNGKTTAACMLDSIVRSTGLASGRIGTVEYAWNGQVRPAPRTTPEAPELFSLLSEMRAADVRWVAMEVSSHGLSLGRVRSASFDVAAFLNLRRDHLDFHRTMEAYLDAKAILFESLSAGATAILNADDPSWSSLAGRTACPVLTFGRSAGSDIRIVSDESSVSGSRCLLETSWGEIPVRTRLAGAFNLENAAAAAACALAGGLAPEAVTDGIQRLRSVPGRMEPIPTGLPFSVFVDYAHTADALQALLQAAGKLGGGRILLVFGCGGDRDRGKRAAMGAAAAAGADRLFPTSDNPRGEDPLAILRQVQAGIDSVEGGSDRTLAIPGRKEAIQAALAAAGTGDVVLIAGKGHETTQTIGEKAVPFDDRKVAREILSRMEQEERHAGA